MSKIVSRFILGFLGSSENNSKEKKGAGFSCTSTLQSKFKVAEISDIPVEGNARQNVILILILK